MSPSKYNINIRSLDAIDGSMAVNMTIARSSAAKRCILSFPARQMGRVRIDFHLHRERPCVFPPRQIYVLGDGAGILSAFSSASRRIRILRMVGSVSVSIFFSKFLMLLRCTKSSWMLGIARSFPEGSSQTKRDVTRFTTMRPTICTLIVVFCCSAQAAYLELLFTSWGTESAAAAPVDSKPPATGFLDAGRSEPPLDSWTPSSLNFEARRPRWATRTSPRTSSATRSFRSPNGASPAVAGRRSSCFR